MPAPSCRQSACWASRRCDAKRDRPRYGAGVVVGVAFQSRRWQASAPPRRSCRKLSLMIAISGQALVRTRGAGCE